MQLDIRVSDIKLSETVNTSQTKVQECKLLVSNKISGYFFHTVFKSSSTQSEEVTIYRYSKITRGPRNTNRNTIMSGPPSFSTGTDEVR
jgi:hypothetical protein